MTNFIDSKGKIGRPRKAPEAEIEVEAKPGSRSVRDLFKPRPQRLRIVKRNYYYYIDVSNVIGDKIRVKSSDAKRLANWILGDKK